MAHLVLNSLLHNVGGLGYGRYVPALRSQITAFVTYSPRDMQRTSNQWGSIFLGRHDRQASRRSLCVLGYWLVQPHGPGCGDDGNQVCNRIPRRIYRRIIIIAPSFACATFISTAATIGTNYKPNSHKTIGIYAAVLLAQGTAQLSYIFLETQTKPDAGAINTFGVRILKYLNNVSVWWHALGTTSLVIAILATAPKLQSGTFVFRTFIDGTGVDGGVGWSQRASPAYVAVIGILMAQYTLTGRIALFS